MRVSPRLLLGCFVQAGEAAIKQLDANGDGIIDDDEMMQLGGSALDI